jgi:hypothetical protein
MRPRQPTEAIRGSAPSWLEPARPWPKQAVRRAGAGPACGCQSRLAVRFALSRRPGAREDCGPLAIGPASPSPPPRRPHPGSPSRPVRAQAVVHRGSRARALPKTTRSKRSVPVARSVMRRLEQHLSEFCRPDCRCPCVHRTCGWPTIPLLGTRCLAAGRAACRVGRYNLPRTSAQLCRDYGGRGA